jgi:hypothetical protein
MSGGGGGGGETEVTQKLGKQQKRLLGLSLPIIRDLFKGLEGSDLIFPGSTIPGFNPFEQQARGSIAGAAGGALPETAQTALDAFKFFTGPGLDPTTNPNLQAAIGAAQRPLFENLTESVLPAVRGGAVTAGGFGGSRQGIAEGLASGRTAQAAGDVGANIANQGFQRSLQAGVAALGLGPQVAGLQLAPGQALGALGAQSRGLQSGRLEERKQNFLNEKLLPFLLAQQAAGLAFGVPGGKSVSEITGAGPTSFQSALGGGATGAGLGAGIGSLFPGIGTGVGAGLGGLLGTLGGLFF